MKKLLLALSMLPLGAGIANAQPAGDAAAGKALWDKDLLCKNCHGANGEGAFGPDLAGRGLSYNEFRRAVRQPWGIMPAFPEETVSDKELGDLTAYMASMQKNDEPGPWRVAVPANAPQGQRTMISIGCGQCHGPYLVGPRDDMGAVDADVNWLKGLVYMHTETLRPHDRMLGTGNGPPRIHMGNFNPDRVTEGELSQILDWVKNDAGFRAYIFARLGKGEAGANGVTYPLTVKNVGLAGKGVTAEDLTIQLMVPKGTNVVGAGGAGYKGTHMDAKSGALVAEWSLAKAGPQDAQAYSITLSKAATKEDDLHGQVVWTKPMVKPGPTDQANIPNAPL
jgi:mono/diheme cytochrome c family protein